METRQLDETTETADDPTPLEAVGYSRGEPETNTTRYTRFKNTHKRAVSSAQGPLKGRFPPQEK
ncbi:MAG: hypothetical protein ABJ360_20960 [Roseobacter sp.]